MIINAKKPRCPRCGAYDTRLRLTKTEKEHICRICGHEWSIAEESILVKRRMRDDE